MMTIKELSRVGLGCFTLLVMTHGSTAAHGQCGPGAISGIVFDDRNTDGSRSPGEPGIAGVVAQAVNAQGQVIGQTTSGQDGFYSIPFAITGTTRIQFSAIPQGFSAGPVGAEAKPLVSFVTTNSCTHNVGLTSLSTSCPGNPTLSTTCFASGDPLAGGSAGNLSTVINFPYDAAGTLPLPRHQGAASELGSVWGLAYQRTTGKIFAGAFLKRHAGFGPLGTGGIYLIDAATGSASPFVDLAALGIATGANPRVAGDLSATAGDPSNDVAAWSAVGKIGLGDLEMSDDDQTLYVVNLFSKSLHKLSVGLIPTVPTAANVSTIAIPNPGCTNGDYVPMAVTEHLGELYVGVVCTAETSQQRADLAAKVLKRVGSGWEIAFEMSLANFTRGYTVIPGIAPEVPDAGGENRPWLTSFSQLLPPSTPLLGAFFAWPQMILGNIKFADDGSMVLGLVDRTAHQFGPFDHAPIPGSTFIEHAPSTGDLLRVFRVNGSYVLENNGACPGCTPTLGANNGQGPGGGEFYYEDNHRGELLSEGEQGTAFDYHQEVALGSLVVRPGSGETVATVYNPTGVRESSGIRAFDNTNGTTRRSYQAYEEAATGRFGKAAGLGDLEILCDVPTQQLGDRVWLDLDNDGIQDAAEPGIAGVTVQLINEATGDIVATKVTDASGNYVFDAVKAATNYIIRLGNSADYVGSGPLSGRVLASRDSTEDTLDSDATIAGARAEIRVRTGGPGSSNHTADFGFYVPQCTTRSLSDVSATIDGSGAALRIISRNVVHAIRRAQKAQSCRSNLSATRLNALLAAQDALYNDVWGSAWSIGGSTVECSAVPVNCTSVSTLGLTETILGTTDQMRANLATLLNNSCGKVRGQRSRFAAYRRAVKAQVAGISAQIAKLGTSVTACR